MSQPPRNKVIDVLRADSTPLDQMSAFERWILPDMEDHRNEQQFAIASPDNPRPAQWPEPGEDLPPEEETVAPLTAEEVEAIRQAAHDEGYAEGKSAGYTEGKTQGYREGYASGEADVRAAVIRLSQVCRTLMDAVTPQDDALEKVLCQLVTQMATEVVRRELKLDSSGMLSVVREAIRCIPPGSERIRVHLNPDDISLVEGMLDDAIPWDAQWRLLPHRSVTPGGCIIDTDEAVVDARAEKRLSTVLAQTYARQTRSLTQEPIAADSVMQLMDEVPAFAEDAPADEPPVAEAPVAEVSAAAELPTREPTSDEPDAR
jgi:flagellar assembly protein FliH